MCNTTDLLPDRKKYIQELHKYNVGAYFVTFLAGGVKYYMLSPLKYSKESGYGLADYFIKGINYTVDRLVKHCKEVMPLDTCVRLQLVHNYTYAYKHVPGGYHYYDLYLAPLFPIYRVEPRFPIESLRVFPQNCCVGTLELAFEDKCSTYFVAQDLEIVSEEPFKVPVSAGDLASDLQDFINSDSGRFPNGNYDVNATISGEEEDGSALVLELINSGTDTKYRFLCKISEMEE